MAIPGLLDPIDPEKEGRSDARRTVRLATQGMQSDGAETLVRLHNISAGGLMLESDEPLAHGDEIVIDLPEAGLVSAHVVWRSESLHGCRFDRPLPSSALSAAELASAIAPVEERPGPHHAGHGSLGKRLANLRQERGLTLAQVAHKLGVSKPTVWAWEHDRSQPVASRIGALAQTLGVPEAELITGRDVSQADNAIAEARRIVAETYGCALHQVRIMIDL